MSLTPDPYSAFDRQRWVAEDPAHKRADRDDFARDRARLVHSAALRRLAAKTQVLAPGDDDFVRNRLTHSLEVAQIGREFGAVLGCNADVVDSACLAHDLGHPLRSQWETALDALAADIGGFEGNAQTLRILTRLEAKRTHPDGSPAGLNLTGPPSTRRPSTRGDAVRSESDRKFGVYEDDHDVFAWFRDGVPAGHRSFEAEVMDWSDDVAYSVHDVEDAIASGGWTRALRDADVVGAVLDVARIAYAADLAVADLGSALERLLATGAVPESFDGARGALAGLKDMTSRLVGRFVRSVEEATREAHGQGALVRHEADLIVPVEARAECAVLKAVAAHFVMNVRARLEVQAGEREVINALVAAYRADPGRLDRDLRADHDAATSEEEVLRVVIDQVASLTDTRARHLHRAWS